MAQRPAPLAYPYPYQLPAQYSDSYQNAPQSQASMPYPYPYQEASQNPVPYPYPYESPVAEPVPRAYEPIYQNSPSKKLVQAPSKRVPGKSQRTAPMTSRVPLPASNQDPPKSLHPTPPHSPLQASSQDNDNKPKVTQDGRLDEVNSVPSTSTDKKTGWLDSKKVRLVLLLLLLLLILLVAIVPLLVVLLLSQPKSSAASTPCANTYSQAYTTASSTASDCAGWQSFVASLTCSSYSKMRIYGTNDPVGLTITSSAVATAIAAALRGSTTYTGSSNGYTWAVGPCGSGIEITSTGSWCNCNTGYTIRPCILNNNWGGINGPTCSPAAQTISLYFE